ncbi:MAG: formylglycine-generating enzyme family protein [Gemmataceae bacterium]
MDAVRLLLNALHAQPYDSTCWLALGDALEETGHEEAAQLHRARQRRWMNADDRHAEQEILQLTQRGIRAPMPRLINSLGMELTLLPPGEFWMGSPPGEPGRHPDEHPQHRVRLTRAFYLGTMPVTQDQWTKVMRFNPSWFREGGNAANRVEGLDTRNFPVERVSWFDAEAFCQALSKWPEERQAGRVYRLPTEAEWEYACRAGTTTLFHFGNDLSSDQANLDGSNPEGQAPRSIYLGRTCPVGQYPSNAFGLFDMHGQVWEWCQDWFSEDYYQNSPAVDPPGPSPTARRALRGGGWYYGARIARSAYRYRYEPDARHHDFGLRVACTWHPGVAEPHVLQR